MITFPDTMRLWRKRRNLSQLQLAVNADVSSRHVSFLESGRARPSQTMVLRLGRTMNVPLADQNQMLNAAGFAPHFTTQNWDDAAMVPVRQAMQHMLSSHDPYPALALDRVWRITALNQSAGRLFAQMSIGEGDSLLDAMTGSVLPSFVENWPQVAAATVHRLRVESNAQGGVKVLDQAAVVLSEFVQDEPDANSPVIPVVFRAGSLRLSLFTTLTQFGTAQDVTLDEMRIEHYFPMDEDSAAVLRNLAG